MLNVIFYEEINETDTPQQSGEFYLQTLKNGTRMFFNCQNLTSIKSDLSYLENGEDMFYGCSNLERFEVDLSNLKNGYSMFGDCTKLKKFTSDLSSLINGEDMFSGDGGRSPSGIQHFSSNLHHLTNGTSMFRYCENLTTFESDLSSLENGSYMFYGTNLESFKSDLSSLTNGDEMFSHCINLESFKSDLSSLPYGSNMFDQCEKLTTFEAALSSLTDGTFMFFYCSSLESFTSDLSSLTDGNYMFYGCVLNGQSVANIIHFLPQRENETSTGGNITIGIGISDNDEARDEFAKECYCENWDDLVSEFDKKHWTVNWQYNGPATMSLRGGSTIWAKLEEVIMPSNEDERKPRYRYTSQDGTKFYNIYWYHDSNGNNEGYREFNSLGHAIDAFGVIPK